MEILDRYNDALGSKVQAKWKFEEQQIEETTTKIMDLRRDGVTRRRENKSGRGSLVGFRCDGSRVHDLWTPRYFRPKIHYILLLVKRNDASESYESPNVLP